MTAHVQPASVEVTGSPRLYVHDALTGRVIASRRVADWSVCQSRVDWIAQTIAGEFNCEADDVGFNEMDDRENVTVAGEVVAYIDVN